MLPAIPTSSPHLIAGQIRTGDPLAAVGVKLLSEGPPFGAGVTAPREGREPPIRRAHLTFSNRRLVRQRIFAASTRRGNADSLFAIGISELGRNSVRFRKMDAPGPGAPARLSIQLPVRLH
jgi:hypothetical protein